jgi:hypothetical protein
MYDLEMIERFISFRVAPDYNCDITISTALNIASATEDRELDVYSESEETKDDDYGGYKYMNNIIMKR